MIDAPHVEALDDLREPLSELGRRWAISSHRPRPDPDTIELWNKLLDEWVISPLPLVLRDSQRRGTSVIGATGREIFFSDNSVANWSYFMALEGIVPDLSQWNRANMTEFVPLSFLTKGLHGRRELNKKGWKVCHIEPVSDRKREKWDATSIDRIEAGFRRLLSPSNIFVIPKVISGAGELPEVIAAVAAFEQNH